MSSLPLQFLLLLVAGWIKRDQQAAIDFLIAQNATLLEQIGPRRLRFTDPQRRRLARAANKLSRQTLLRLEPLVTPDTLLKWYRKLVAAKYDGSRKRGPGRPRAKNDIAQLVLRFAQENPRWGYTRIRGALRNLGLDVGRNTIKRILLDAGIDPAPSRGQRTSWSAFLRAHWGAVAALDFFNVEVLTVVGLVRYQVLFVIDLATRRVEICGIHHAPYGEWMRQMARNLTSGFDGFLLQHRYLIMDRDPLFSADFRALLKARGVRSVRLPPRSPDLNAYAERFVRSVRSECLDHMIPLGRAHLQSVLSEYVAHYHLERNHQGLGNRLIDEPAEVTQIGAVRRRKRLGGSLSYYYRDAA